MKTRILKKTTNIILFLLALAFVVKFGGPQILKQYITYGIGNCKQIPLLCMQPEEKTYTPEIDREYLSRLVPQNFPKISILTPRGFNLVNELIKKEYYKRKQKSNLPVIYLLYQEPDAFIKLYPDVKKSGVNDNYEFIRRLENASLNKVENINSAFFVIMKSIFTPNIGSQNSAKIIKFELGELKGFVNYTMTKQDNYFDCNVLDPKGNFFKVYIKDSGSKLDLNKVFTIISTVKTVN